jgi:hypothetical protein
MDAMSCISSYFHCVFSTKERRRLITPELRERFWPFLGVSPGRTMHHRKLPFQEEFLALLRKHRIEYDDRYLWK